MLIFKSIYCFHFQVVNFQFPSGTYVVEFFLNKFKYPDFREKMVSRNLKYIFKNLFSKKIFKKYILYGCRNFGSN